MQVLIVGAGAVGGYFGARLIQSGKANVTFLVRNAEKVAALEHKGLQIRSSHRGDLTLKSVPAVHDLSKSNVCYDMVVITCKAPGLPSVLRTLREYKQNKDFLVLPLLNGLQHLDVLDVEFGKKRVLGGVAKISTVLTTSHLIDHLSALQNITFGFRDQTAPSAQAREVAKKFHQALLQSNNIHSEFTETVMLDMWEKFVTLTTLAGITCLCRGSIGDILRTEEGERVMRKLLDECCSASEVKLRSDRIAMFTKLFFEDKQSTLTSSMMRDMVQGNSTEAKEIVRDMLMRVRAKHLPSDTLAVCWLVLQVHEMKLSKL